jgi:hypothetical protein
MMCCGPYRIWQIACECGSDETDVEDDIKKIRHLHPTVPWMWVNRWDDMIRCWKIKDDGCFEAYMVVGIPCGEDVMFFVNFLLLFVSLPSGGGWIVQIVKNLSHEVELCVWNILILKQSNRIWAYFHGCQGATSLWIARVDAWRIDIVAISFTLFGRSVLLPPLFSWRVPDVSILETISWSFKLSLNNHGIVSKIVSELLLFTHKFVTLVGP